MVAKTLASLEGILAEELKLLGASDITLLKRAVSFTGDKEMLYKANLWCRTAMNVLLDIHKFRFNSNEEFYQQIKSIDWGAWMNVKQNLWIHATANESIFKHSQFVAQFAKDAIVDQFREKTDDRPSVDRFNADLVINIYIHRDECSVSVDSSGEPLFKRGYRQPGHPATMSEVLGAGLVLMSGWDRKQDFFDPMCGSGTLPIEAAMIAANVAPGLIRNNFGFQKWPNFDKMLWNRLLSEARVKKHVPKCRIYGADVSLDSVRIAQKSAKAAGLDFYISFSKANFFSSLPPVSSALIMTNPPYGQRLNEDEDMSAFYNKIGSTLKHTYPGHTVWVLTPDPDLVDSIGLRSTQKHAVFNGPIECRFLKYELYEGSRKIHKNPKFHKPQQGE